MKFDDGLANIVGNPGAIGTELWYGPKHVHQTKHVKQTKHVHRHKVTTTKHGGKNEIAQNNAILMCAEGKQVTPICACGTDASGRPFMCQEGQWCRTLAHACTQ